MFTMENLGLSATFFLGFVEPMLDEQSAKNLALALRDTEIASSSGHKTIAGIPLQCRTSASNAPDALQHGSTIFVSTASSGENLRRLALVLAATVPRGGQSSPPIVLEGASGCGKTTLLRHVSSLLGWGSDLVELHLDDASDGKSLLGQHLATDVPGEFAWTAGAVTAAVQEGRWLVIEDIDRAPFDVLASLAPLMECASHFPVPGLAAPLPVHPQFRLLATRTAQAGRGSHAAQSSVNGPFAAFVDKWLRVPLVSLGSATSAATGAGTGTGGSTASVQKGEEEDLRTLLQALFPAVSSSILDSFHASFQSIQSLPLLRYGRVLSQTDVLRWVRRAVRLTPLLHRCKAGEATGTVFLTEADRLSVVHEGLSVLAGHIPDREVVRGVCASLAACWGLDRSATDSLLDVWKPECKYDWAVDQASGRAQLQLQCGHVQLPVMSSVILAAASAGRLHQALPPGFAPTRHSLSLLERIAAAIAIDEPCLLVGETGNGKTSVVQALAASLGQQLLVCNLNVQTDSGDLVGGFKPLHLKQMAMPLVARFDSLMRSTFPDSTTPGSGSASFLSAIHSAAGEEAWGKVIGGIMKGVAKAAGEGKEGVEAWQALAADVRLFERQFAAQRSSSSSSNASSGMGSGAGQAAQPGSAAFAFSFQEGMVVQALKTGCWLLLDEINLAPPETLQRLAGLLEGGSLVLSEKGESRPVPRHAGFRLFAAMNPSTDYGKRDLVPALRSRFAEVYVPDVEDPSDLCTVVQGMVGHWPTTGPGEGGGYWEPRALVQNVVDFFLTAKRMSAPLTGTLRDGAGQRPHYSLRTLTRALKAAGELVTAGFPVPRALFEGVCMSFVTQLDDGPAATLMEQVMKYCPPGGRKGKASSGTGTTGTTAGGGGKKKDKQAALAASVIARLGGGPAGLDTELPATSAVPDLPDIPPKGQTSSSFVQVAGFWLPAGPCEQRDTAKPGPTGTVQYVLVPSVLNHVRSLARAVRVGRFPVLLQGPTSAGKTSMVEYLAARTGHTCVRINNHEHTDLAEYIGSYVTDPSTGRLSFSEGLLVRALRSGAWLILDELNLAPSDVLEALNRLLDDNRELYIPETQEIVKPHPHFMLFATQNPAGAYGGRKPLSRAFRNRFVELAIEDIPPHELVTILASRTRVAQPFLERMVETTVELHRMRQGSDVFAGKQAFITPRDLLRWAGRGPSTYAALAQEGFALLGERLRQPQEQEVLKSILERVCKAELHPQTVYDAPFSDFMDQRDADTVSGLLPDQKGVQQVEAPRQERGGAGSKRAPEQEPADVPQAKKARHVLEDGDLEHGFTDMLTRRLRMFLSRLRVSRGWQDMMAEDVESAEAHPGDAGLSLVPGTIPGTEGLDSITVTSTLRRLFYLVGRCIAHDEPCLLVGDTGQGKTTVIQLLALLMGKPLHIVNCHAHSETADFLGSLRPVRNKAIRLQAAQEAVAEVLLRMGDKEAAALLQAHSLTVPVSFSVETVKTALSNSTYSSLSSLLSSTSSSPADIALLTHAKEAVAACAPLFEWHDGPLVTAMRAGDFFLLDEASLAEDAVLERLNSVLEPGRTLTLAEKGEEEGKASLVKAAAGFRFFATMNPGGDFGKRELSPALRNRFTEIWVPTMSHPLDLALVLQEKAADVALRQGLALNRQARGASVHALAPFVQPMLSFVQWYDSRASSGRLRRDEEGGGTHATAARPTAGQRAVPITFRDMHAWLHFMGTMARQCPDRLSLWQWYAHGACLVLLDGLGLGASMASEQAQVIRAAAVRVLLQQVPAEEAHGVKQILDAPTSSEERPAVHPTCPPGQFGVHPFYIPYGPLHKEGAAAPAYSLQAPSTQMNLGRVLRALQTARPVLLEGPPGVGKTSLIEALAKASGHTLVRINLSEQSDLADLFGQDLPIPGDGADGGGRFAWSDGVLLTALKLGHWVLLDELNLAPQAVLEGLNAVLDHRGTVFLPDLGLSYACPPSFRIFAAQNPVGQGGGRKGLPKSFLNRFAKVYVESLTSHDQYFITSCLYPALDVPLGSSGVTLLHAMVEYHGWLHVDTMEGGRPLYGLEGRPWEFNLRDLLRWCQLVIDTQSESSTAVTAPAHGWQPGHCLEAAYLHRFRRYGDRAAAAARFLSVFTPYTPQAVTVPDCLSLLQLHTAPVVRTSARAVAIEDVVLPTSAVPGVWRRGGPGVEGQGLGAAQTALLAALDAPLAAARHWLEQSGGPTSSTLHNLPATLLQPLYATAQAVQQGWPVLLVGHASSGKSTIIDALAAAVGARVRKLAITPSTDASEVLGTYEQSDMRRAVLTTGHRALGLGLGLVHALRAVGQVERAGQVQAQLSMFSHALHASVDPPTAAMAELYSILPGAGEGHGLGLGLGLGLAEEAVAPQLAETVQRFNTALTTSLSELSLLCSRVSSHASRGQFEWVDGALVEALEAGEWVLLDNANFAASSVMDRLNPLLEPGGVLILNECGPGSDGKPRTIIPHPSFRIFLTQTPALGEVSRALRNRCAEIALPGTGQASVEEEKVALARAVQSIFSSAPAGSPAREAALSLSSRMLVGVQAQEGAAAAVQGGTTLLPLVRALADIHAIAASDPLSATVRMRRLQALSSLSLGLSLSYALHQQAQAHAQGELLPLGDALVKLGALLYPGNAAVPTALAAAFTSLRSPGSPALWSSLPAPLPPMEGALMAATHAEAKGAVEWLAEQHLVTASSWCILAVEEAVLSCRADGVGLAAHCSSLRATLLALPMPMGGEDRAGAGRLVDAALQAATTSACGQRYAASVAALCSGHEALSSLFPLLPLSRSQAPALWAQAMHQARRVGRGEQADRLEGDRAALVCRISLAMRTEAVYTDIRASCASLSSSGPHACAVPMPVLGLLLAHRLGLTTGLPALQEGQTVNMSARALERLLGRHSSLCAHLSYASLSLLSTCDLLLEQGVQAGAVQQVWQAAQQLWLQLCKDEVVVSESAPASPLPHISHALVCWRRCVKTCSLLWPTLHAGMQEGTGRQLLSLVAEVASSYGQRVALPTTLDSSTFLSVLHQPRDLLWARGGHPFVPRTHATFTALLAVRAALAAAQGEHALPRGLHALPNSINRLALLPAGLLQQCTRGLATAQVLPDGRAQGQAVQLLTALATEVEQEVTQRLPRAAGPVEALVAPSRMQLDDMEAEAEESRAAVLLQGQGQGQGEEAAAEEDYADAQLGVELEILHSLGLLPCSSEIARKAVRVASVASEQIRLWCLAQERCLHALLLQAMAQAKHASSGQGVGAGHEDVLDLGPSGRALKTLLKLAAVGCVWPPESLVPLTTLSWCLSSLGQQGSKSGEHVQRMWDLWPAVQASWGHRAEAAGVLGQLMDTAYLHSTLSAAVSTLCARPCPLYDYEGRVYLVHAMVAAAACVPSLLGQDRVGRQETDIAAVLLAHTLEVLLSSLPTSGNQPSSTLALSLSLAGSREEEMQACLDRVQACQDARGLQAMLRAAIAAVHASLSSPSSLPLSCRALGLVSLARLHLLAPATPVDPGAKAGMKREIAGGQVEDLTANIDHRVLYLSLTRRAPGYRFSSPSLSSSSQGQGQGQDLPLERLQREREGARAVMEKQEGKLVYRVNEGEVILGVPTPPFPSLHADVSSFLSSVLHPSRCEAVGLDLGLGVGGQAGKTSPAEAQAWVSSVLSFASQVEERYGGVYSDVVCPLVAECRGVARAVGLMQGGEEGDRGHALTVLPSSGPVSTADRASLHLSLPALLSSLTSQAQARHALVEAERQGKEIAAGETVRLVSETDEERNERLFRESVPDYFTAHFGHLLPAPKGQEGERADHPSQAMRKAKGQGATAAPAPPADTTTGLPTLAIADAYLRLYSSGSEGLESYTGAQRLPLPSPHSGQAGGRGGAGPMGDLLAYVGRLTARSPVGTEAGQESRTPSPDGRPYDFYRSPNISECALIIRPASALAARALALLRLFPHNEVLALILRVAHQLMRLDIQSPLAAFLAGAELLVSKCHDWEGNAPKVHQLGDTLPALAGVVTRWRRIELGSWAKLLAVTEFKEQELAVELFLLLRAAVLQECHALPADELRPPPPSTTAFHSLKALLPPAVQTRMYDWMLHSRKGGVWPSLPLSPGMEAFLRTCLELCDRYIRGSTQGQYGTRAAMLGALAGELEHRAREEGPRAQLYHHLSWLLSGVCSFYSQYSGRVADALSAAKGPVLKQMAEQISLHRWDAQSYYASKESAEKAHRLVHSAVVSYSRVLQVVVGPVLDDIAPHELMGPGREQEGEGDKGKKRGKKGAAKGGKAVEADEGAIPVPPIPVPVTALATYSLPPSLAMATLPPLPGTPLPLPALLKRMHALLTKGAGAILSHSSRSARSSCTEGVESFSSDALSLVRELAGDSSKGGRVGKRRALIRGLKGLQRMGLSPLLVDTPPQASDKLFSSQVPIPSSSLLPAPLATLAHTAVRYGMRAQDALLRAQVLLAAGQVHEDITAAEAKRGLGLSQHALYLCSQGRVAMAAGGVQARALSLLLQAVQQGVRAGKQAVILPLPNVEHAAGSLHALQTQCSSVCSLLGQCKGVLRSIARTMLTPSSSPGQGAAQLLALENIADEASLLGLLPAIASGSDEVSTRLAVSSLPPILSSRMQAVGGMEEAVARVQEACKRMEQQLRQECPSETQLDCLLRCLPGSHTYTPEPVTFPSLHASWCVRLAGEQLQAVVAAGEVREGRQAVQACLDSLQSDASCTLLTPLLTSTLTHLLHACDGTLAQVQARLTPSAGAPPAASSTEVLADVVKGMLLCVQGVVSSGPSSPLLWCGGGTGVGAGKEGVQGEDAPSPQGMEKENVMEEAGEAELGTDVHVVKTHAAAVYTLQSLSLPSLLSSSLPLLSHVSPLVPAPAAGLGEDTGSSTLAPVAAMLEALVAVHTSLLSDACSYYKSLSKLALLAASVTVRLMREGFCTPPEGKEGGEGEGDGTGEGAGGQGRFEAGTGIGQGDTTGAKDVSEQIESEDQVLGLRNEEEREGQEGEDKNPQGGLDMAGDFQGELEDVPPPGPQDEGEGEGGEKEEDMERTMGEASGPNSNIVDEKLWAGQDQEEEGEEEGEGEKGGEKTKPASADSQVASGQQQKQQPGLRAKQGGADSKPQPAGQPQEGEEEEAAAGAEEAEGEAEEGQGEEQGKEEEKGDDSMAGLRPDGPLGEDKPLEGMDVDGEEEGKEEEGKEKDGGLEEEVGEKKPHTVKVGQDDEEGAGGVGGEEEGEGEDAPMEEDSAADGPMPAPNPDAGQEGGGVEEDEGALPEHLHLEDEGEGEGEGQGPLNDRAEGDLEAEELAPEGEDGSEEAGQEHEAGQGEGEAEVPPDSSEGQGTQAAPGLAAKGGNSRLQQQHMGGPQAKQERKSRPTGPRPPPSERRAEQGPRDEAALQDASAPEEEEGAALGGEEDDDGEEEGAMAVDRDGQGEDESGRQWKKSAPRAVEEGGEEGKAKRRFQRKLDPSKPALQAGAREEEEPNPLLDPSKALRHWQARLRNQQQQEQGEEEGEQEGEQGGEVGRNSQDVDMMLHRQGGQTLLAPRQEEEKEGEEGEDAMDEGAAPFPSEEEEEEDGGEGALPEPGQGEGERAAPEQEQEAGPESYAMEEEEEGGESMQQAKERKASKKKPSAGQEMQGITVDAQGAEDEDEDGGEGAAGRAAREQVLRSIALAAEGGRQGVGDQQPITISSGHSKRQRDALQAGAPGPAHEEGTEGEGQGEGQGGGGAPDLATLRQEYDAALAAWGTGSDATKQAEASRAWSSLCALTAEPAARLCESLRLVLEPTLASKLGGEYRSGKRIAMRRVIAYIASQYRKDKIWMRRSKPSSRSYQVLLALDDSASMSPANRGAGGVALEALTLLARALARLEVGQVGVVSYGRTVQLLHPLDQPFTDDCGARLLSSFTFAQPETRTEALLSSVTAIMEGARASAGARGGAGVGSTVKVHQLVFLLSDGLVGSGPERERIRQWVMEASAKGLLLVLVIIDKGAAGSEGVTMRMPSVAAATAAGGGGSSSSSSSAPSESILSTRTIKFVGGKVVSAAYLDDYPFPYYMLVPGGAGAQALPEVLADGLRQWFELAGSNQ